MGLKRRHERAQVQANLFGKSEERRLDLSQFYTPRDIALKMARWIPGGARVVEPSAGRGALLEPIIDIVYKPVAYEVDPNNVRHLERRYFGRLDVRARDFMGDADPGEFDIAVMNPPYEGDQDVDHVERALDISKRAVCLLRSVFRHGKNRFERFWRWHDPVRIADIAERPFFGGDDNPKADFTCFEIRRRKKPRIKGEPFNASVEWW